MCAKSKNVFEARMLYCASPIRAVRFLLRRGSDVVAKREKEAFCDSGIDQSFLFGGT